MSAPVSLEAALTKVAAEHNLQSITVGRMPVGERVVWTATVHWNGYARSGTSCAGGHSDISTSDALANAIVKAREDRLADIVIPALEMEQAA